MNASKSSDKAAQMPKSDADQIKAFRKAARELGGDQSDGRFQAALKVIGKAKPKTDDGIRKAATKRQPSRS